MAISCPEQEGLIPFRIPSIDRLCHTYYKILGDLSSGRTPVICLHGGPGAGHNYFAPFVQLWTEYSIPVVLYDQIGCGLSTRLPDTAGDYSFWQESVFIAELENLIEFFRLRSGYHLLGQSWGGMLGAAFASNRPPGLQRLVLANALASRKLSDQSYKLRRDELPPRYKNAILEAERTKNFQSTAYQNARMYLYRTFLCRLDPWPPEMLVGFNNMRDDTTVYGTLNGTSSPWLPDGSMRDWTSIPRLPSITAPTLVYYGEFDTAHEIAQIPFFELIPRVRMVKINGVGHMCHLEDTDRVLRLVGEFLTQSSTVESDQ